MHIPRESKLIRLSLLPKHITKQGVCHNVALQFTLESILKAKRRIMEVTQIFHHAKNNNFPKSPLKKTKILQDIIIITSIITNLSSFNTSQNIIFQKSSENKNRPIIIIT
jgi:hypothetical protein